MSGESESSVAHKIGRMEGRLDGVDKRLDGLEAMVNDKLSHLSIKQDAIAAAIVEINQKMAVQTVAVKASWKTITVTASIVTAFVTVMIWLYQHGGDIAKALVK